MYQITVTARGFYSEGGEMYQITLDLEQKPAMLEHFFFLEKTIISPALCILEELCDISRTIKLSFLL